jgi:hypothetical protein
MEYFHLKELKSIKFGKNVGEDGFFCREIAICLINRPGKGFKSHFPTAGAIFRLGQVENKGGLEKGCRNCLVRGVKLQSS